jgi:uncharacterized protein (DUF697 family)
VAGAGSRALLAVARDVRSAVADRRPLVVDGARELVPLLARELRAGGDPTAVQEGGSARSAAVLVWIGPSDLRALREASRARVPIVGITEGESLPYVLDTNLVVARRGEGLPVAELVRAVARVVGERGSPLASRLPVLREPVVDELVRVSARRNALVAAAVFVPGAAMPILTLNQVRLVLGIALAYGEEIGGARLPEIAGVVGAGFGFRAVARELLDLVPVAGFAAKGAIAYAGTTAVGEGARRLYSDKSVRPGS